VPVNKSALLDPMEPLRVCFQFKVVVNSTIQSTHKLPL
jgi:hypothetical protein